MFRLLSLILSAQLFLSGTSLFPAPEALTNSFPSIEKQQVLWGLIDPQLAVWCTRLPEKQENEASPGVLWDWSWHGFLTALFRSIVLKEAPHHDIHV